MELEPEAGLDRARELLDRYDATNRTWDLDREGALWDAVALARTAGVLIEAPLIAVIDTAFDVDLPAIAEHQLVWPNEPRETTTHGTVAALLVLETAPDARLLLYPAARGSALDEERVAEAIADAAGRGARILNLSMSIRRPVSDWLASESIIEALVERYRRDKAEGRPTLEIGDSELDLDFAKVDVLAANLRKWINPPSTPIGRAVLTHTGPTTTFFAAAGNENAVLPLPAVLAEVVAVGFIRERRWVEEGAEWRVARVPTYAQSSFMDIALIQPENVVGSSFATPLVAGFCARYCTDEEVQQYVGAVHLTRTAEELHQLTLGTDWHDLRQGRVRQLFDEALALAPHQHETRRTGGCAPCAFFTLPLFIGFGLFELGWGRPERAGALFAGARDFAPKSIEPAANLAVALAEQAALARTRGELGRVRELLVEAEDHMSFACHERPTYKPYRLVLDDVREGLASPATFTSPSSPGDHPRGRRGRAEPGRSPS